MSIEKQDKTQIASASGQNRAHKSDDIRTVLEGVREDLEITVARLRVSEDLGRALGARLLVRHEEIRRLRAVPDELRGAV